MGMKLDEMTPAQLVEQIAEARRELLRRKGDEPQGWHPQEAQELAESIYLSWKAGNTCSDRWGWFMVKMEEADQKLCQDRSKREE